MTATGEVGLQPLTALAGIGPARARKLARLGLARVRDLLFLVPRRLAVSGERCSARAAASGEGVEVGSEVAVLGTLRALRLFRAGRRRSVLSAELCDASGSLRVLFFNQPWLFERLRALSAAQQTIELCGRIGTTKQGRALLAPKLDSAPAAERARALVPVYPLTEGVGQELLRKLCAQALELAAGTIDEPLSAAELAALALPALPQAVELVQRPRSADEFERGRARLAFEHLLVLQARLARARLDGPLRAARVVRLDEGARAELRARLPFVPTAGQRRVLDEILDDLAHTRPMRRLLQGEVGAGKTLVALAACAAVARGAGQAALLAPTELLAEQHFLGLRAALAGFGLEAVLLTGSLRARARRAALDQLASGRAQLAIGTHALFSPEVAFARLDLVVIDEQQRFGVAQKQALLEKGADVHALLMSATPIPRTLALCFYGDLETSLLAERPPGRAAVTTRIVGAEPQGELTRFLRTRLAQGERVFWVCPRIETSDEEESDAELEPAADERDSRAASASAERAAANLRAGELAAFGIELVHGRVPTETRAAAVERFRAGASRVLVGTAMIEVGIDVPEATVMVIEGAERFGLAQLHQLRGRVGRSARASWCFLSASGAGGARLRFLETCANGFEIAEEDLRQRGMGDLGGQRQAGVNSEGLSAPELDLERVLFARRLVRERPELAQRYLGAGTGAALV